MTITEAKQIAQLYVSEMGEILSGFIFGQGKEETILDCYFFDFTLLTLNGEIPEDPPQLGGARGLTVNKHIGQVEIVSHGCYFALLENENKITEAFHLLSDFKDGNL